MKQDKVDFFVVGAARSGTTSLYNYLIQHPEIYLTKIKELNYFSEVESKDLSLYDKPEKNQFYHTKIIKSANTYEKLFEAANSNQLKGDISPSYMWDKNTAQRIYNYNPNAKIIISLRNPVHRAFSHYVMNFGIGQETNLTFKEALNAPKENIWGGGNLYIELGEYYEAIKPYYKYFKPKNIKLLVFEDWTTQKEKTLEDLFSFLEIDTTFKVSHEVDKNQKVAYKNIKTLNLLRNPKIKKIIEFFLFDSLKDSLKTKLFKKEDFSIELDPKTQSELEEYFKPQVEKLNQLLNRNLLEKWNLEREFCETINKHNS